MHRDTEARGQNVLRRKGIVRRQGLDGTFGETFALGNSRRALAREGQHRADAAIDIDPAVLARRPGPEVLEVEFLLHLHQAQADLFEHQRAFMERQTCAGRGLRPRGHGRAPPRGSIPARTICATTARRGIEQRLAISVACAPVRRRRGCRRRRWAAVLSMSDVLPCVARGRSGETPLRRVLPWARSASFASCARPIAAADRTGPIRAAEGLGHARPPIGERLSRRGPAVIGVRTIRASPSRPSSMSLLARRDIAHSPRQAAVGECARISELRLPVASPMVTFITTASVPAVQR